MHSLVLELQADALNPQVRVSDLLRKALAVAKKVGIAEIEEWINLELYGYPVADESKIPQYRKLSGTPVATDLFGKTIHISLGSFSVEGIRKLTTFLFHFPIGTFESALEDDSSPIEVTYNREVDLMLSKALRHPITGDSGLAYHPRLQFSKSQFRGVLDVVRNTVLEWALRLEKDGILGEGMALTKEEKHLASSITYNVHVEHMSNSQFQQGTQHSTQILEASRDLEKVNELLQLLKGSLDKMRLDSQKRSELEAEIGTIETQLASPKPKGTIIREAGRSIRNILEGAAGSSLATAIGNQLPLLLQILQNWPT